MKPSNVRQVRPFTRASLLQPALWLPVLLASSAAAGAASVSYRYYRFEPVALQMNGTAIQLSEFTFGYQGKNLNLVANNPEAPANPTKGQDGTAVNMVPVTVTGGERAVTDVEGALKIVDGDVATKWITAIAPPKGYLVFDFGKSTPIDAYNFATGADTATYPNRNPLTWKLSGSDDGNSWVVVDRETNMTAPALNSTYFGGFSATGVFKPSTYAFLLSFGQAPIVKDGGSVDLYWDAYDIDLSDTINQQTTTTITPSISSQKLNITDSASVIPPRNADTTYTLTASNSSGTSDPRTLWVRSVTGGTSTYQYYRFTPTRTRSGSDQVQMAEFAFYKGGKMLNLVASNASPAQTVGSDGTTTSMLPVIVTNPGGSNDVNATDGAVRLVDGNSNFNPNPDGSASTNRFLDNNRKPIVFQFSAATAIDSYQFTTSYEASNADPVRWIMEGSNDGTAWTMIENVTSLDYPLPTDRISPTQIFPLPGISLKQTIGTVAPTTWTGTTNNDYQTAGNWSTGKVPAASDEIAISTGTPSINANLERNAVSTISGSANLTVSGRFINRGTFNMVGGAINQTGNYFLIGNTTTGTMNHTGGTITSNLDRGWFLSDDGGGAGSRYFLSGTAALNVTLTGPLNDLYNVHLGKGGAGDVFNMSGGNANFTATGTNNVYLSRGASMLVSGGNLTVKNFATYTLGWQQGDLNHFDITGGTVKLDNTPLKVGSGFDGEVTLGGGSLTVGSTIDLGTGAGKGTFTMTAGTLSATNITSTANGSFVFNGGTITLTGDQSAIVTQSWFKGATGTAATYDATLNQTRIAIGSSSGGSAFSTWATAAGLTGTQAASTADPDGDGMSNLLEFALNGNPASAGSRGKTSAVLSSGSGLLTAAVRQNAAFTSTGGVLSATVDGITYTVQGSTNLATWTSEVEEVTPAVAGSVATPDTGWTLRSFHLKNATGASGYLRIQVSETP